MSKLQNTKGRKIITQPPDWWDAFANAAEKKGTSLSEWIGEAGKLRLSKRTRKQLSTRITRGRPKKV